jgi:hypothetical protein
MFAIIQRHRNKRMNRKKSASLRNQALALATLLGLTAVAQADGAATPYAKMAPVADYLMPEKDEIALARSAAPAAISDNATIVVLKQHGYETAVKGKNGFVCIVERSWMAQFDFPEYWNPKMHGAICFNGPAVRTVLPYTYKRTAMILAGVPKEEVIERLKQVVAKKEVPALEAGAMCYMMSKNQYLNDQGVHWHPHLMFYGTKSATEDWGNDVPNSPVLLNAQFQTAPEPLVTYMVVVDQWSDGTLAPIPH